MAAKLIDERFLLHSDDLSNPLDFTRLFGRLCPVEVEIGIGKGRFLLGEAERRPDVDFLGIERVRKYLRVALDRLNRLGCGNVRFVCEDAGFLVRQLIPDKSVEVFHIYFPDPWPKRRHHKRRLLTRDFAARLRQKLRPGGQVRIATDFREYFQEMITALDSVDGWSGSEIRTEPARGADAIDATHYEVKYERERRIIYRAAYIAESE